MSVSRDYANKKRKPAKSKGAKAKAKAANARKPAGGASKKGKAKKSASKLPWSQAFWALVAMSALGYILYMLSNTPVDPQPQPAKQTAQPKQQTPAAETKPEQTEPVKPTFTYHKVLKDKELQVDIDTSKQQVDKNLIMQCGSFLKYEQADTLKAQIAFTGLTAEIKQTEEKDGKTWFRVVLGPYKTKRAADADNHRLQAAKINRCVIW